ncbi:MAG: hypothetical protein JWR13_2177 [Mycobacterium sp.]|jgi:hypothetical protein|nr:hypothetical protein [Mycobacterium sp.]MDT5070782.1 hypothetical protein [Mycobacterium sp.]MDT5316740.1 hypothetical protein [Mycobacterium sp.]
MRIARRIALAVVLVACVGLPVFGQLAQATIDPPAHWPRCSSGMPAL